MCQNKNDLKKQKSSAKTRFRHDQRQCDGLLRPPRRFIYGIKIPRLGQIVFSSFPRPRNCPENRVFARHIFCSIITYIAQEDHLCEN